MGTIPQDKIVGDEVNATEINDLRDGAYTPDLTGGETINGGKLPVACFIVGSDGEDHR